MEKESYGTVFLFNIEKSLKQFPNDAYEAIRKYWRVGKWQYSSDMYAVGLVKGNAYYTFSIDRWEKSDGEIDMFGKSTAGKFKFFGKEYNDLYLLNLDWSCVLNYAKGYWQYGNYLVITLNKGKFKILRGSEDKNWHIITEKKW